MMNVRFQRSMCVCVCVSPRPRFDSFVDNSGITQHNHVYLSISSPMTIKLHKRRERDTELEKDGGDADGVK